MPGRYPSLTWSVLGLISTAAWYITATRIARIVGMRDAASAIGLLAAVLVAITLWRWALADRRQTALTHLRCPQCDAQLRTEHEHARPGGVETGVQRWRCEDCGFEHTEALTCPRCAA
ncbi:MAG TPA: hypothetical protein QF624_09195 [Dehalococcoidia bacterium]|nr:hypothetical protein [Dehalococcoidia bacterium]